MTRTLTLKDAEYPASLKAIPDPPQVLYVRGTLWEEDRAAVAIVGTRRASPYGLATARRLGQELARAGITVVSGLAEGIDGAAHEGALEGGGRTLAVLGHGLHTLYPPQHRSLADQIAASGALVSEFSLGTDPVAWHFPRRNRIISGLSLGVVVVEAPLRSGALITARLALEQGREVFAVPGPTGSHQSRGTHALLKDGARLAEGAEDILEELAPQLRDCLKTSSPGLIPASAGTGSDSRPSSRRRGSESPLSRGWASFRGNDAVGRQGQVAVGDLTSEEARVFDAVPIGAWADLGAISRRTALEPARLMAVLTGLELKGLIAQSPGRGYSRP